MRNLLTALVVILTTQSCGQQSDPVFITKVTGDFSRNSVFIAVQVTLANESISSVIENDDLYYYFHKTKGYNEATYKHEIIKILKSKKAVPVTSADFVKYGFRQVNEMKDLQEEARKGKSLLLNKYFKDNVLVKGVKKETRDVLISLLFEWNIASRIDDESGYLVIDSKR